MTNKVGLITGATGQDGAIFRSSCSPGAMLFTA